MAKLYYVDNYLILGDTRTPDLQGNSVCFGKANSGPAYYFSGLIDDVRIYNRALSAPEIAELYRMDATGTVTTTGALSAPP